MAPNSSFISLSDWTEDEKFWIVDKKHDILWAFSSN